MMQKIEEQIVDRVKGISNVYSKVIIVLRKQELNGIKRTPLIAMKSKSSTIKDTLMLRKGT